MKTVIIIENGHIEVQVDDGKPVVMETSPVAQDEQRLETPSARTSADEPVVATGAPLEPSDQPVPPPVDKPEPKTSATQRSCSVCEGPIPSSKHGLAQVCSTECQRERWRRKNASARPKDAPAIEHLTCEVCGDPIEYVRGNGRRPKVCKKAECKKERNRLGKRAWDKSLNDPSQSTPPPVSSAIQKPNPVPETPVVDTTPRQEVKAFTIRVPQERDQAQYGGIRQPQKTGSFEDPWNCQPCRDYEQICRLHKAMMDRGEAPPKRNGNAPGMRIA